MKKIVCFVLAFTLILGVASMALAAGVSASYKDGVLTVSANIDSSDFRAYAVLVDGNDTGRSLTAASNTVTISKTYEAGSHTVSVENDFAGVLGTASFTVPGAEPPGTEPPVTEPPVTEPPVTEPPVTEPPVTEPPVTEPPVTEEPDAPLALSGVKYQNGVITFYVTGLKKSAEVWLDGSATDMSIPGSGSYTLNRRLKAGTHTLMIFNPTLESTPTRTFEVVVTQPTISGSYTKVGVLNITVGGLNNPSEIWLDGAATSLAVNADGSYVLNVELTEGTHKLMVFDQINDLKGYADVVVDHIWKITPAKDATCTADGNTEGKVCEICGKVEAELTVIPALGHDIITDAGVAATCTKAGLTEGQHCSRCGEATVAQTEIPALGHNYVVVERTVTKVLYKCTRCGDSFTDANTKAVKNAYGTIVYDANMVDVDYTASANKLDSKVLVIVADLTCKADLTTELGLYLSEDLIKQLTKDGFTAVNFQNGDASIVIELAEIKPEWFAEGTAIWNYVFSTDPAAEGGILVKVEAQISGTEKVPAEAFTGVTLKKADGDVAVTANGIY